MLGSANPLPRVSVSSEGGIYVPGNCPSCVPPSNSQTPACHHTPSPFAHQRIGDRVIAARKISAKMPPASSSLSVVDSDVVSDEILGLIRPHFGSVKTPSTYDKVYKDECMFSFDT